MLLWVSSPVLKCVPCQENIKRKESAEILFQQALCFILLKEVSTLYTNAIDTFIFDDPLKREIYTANAQGMLYSSMISGLHPTLSLNQAVDSPVIHSILKDDSNSEFLKLIKSKTIRIARYKAIEPTMPDAIDAYILPKLAGQKYCEFSSLPFLNKADTRYSESQKSELMKKLLECCLTSGPVLDTAFKNYAECDDSLILYHWVNNLRKLKAAVNMQYLPCSKSAPFDVLALYKRVIKAINVAVMHSDGYCFDELNALKARLKDSLNAINMTSDNKKSRFLRDLSSRSGLYRLIRELRCNTSHESELKALVDICYNEIVAESISDTEESIMVNLSETQYAEIILEAENVMDKDVQKLALAKCAMEGKQNALTWSDLNQILYTVNQKYKNSHDLDKWYILMQDTLSENGIKDVVLKQQKLFLGTISFASSAAASIYGLLEKSNTGLILGGLSLGISALNMIFTSCQNRQSLKAAVNRLPVYQEAQELLTQTVLLKHSYNDPE